MINDGTPSRVFKIGELARAIASQLVLSGSKSAVNLACTCQNLEEPTLSALWETTVVGQASGGSPRRNLGLLGFGVR